jgi:Subtilase family
MYHHRDTARQTRQKGRGTAIEALERRQLLSAALDLVTPHQLAPKPKPVHHQPLKKPVQTIKKSTQTKKTVTAKAAGSVSVPTANPGAIKLAGPFAKTAISSANLFTPGAAPFTPQEIRHFYGIDQITFGGIQGTGAGQTIAIIDAYSQPDLRPTTDPNYTNLSINSDLYDFDQLFGLPDPPSFIKLNENGGTTLPTAYDPNWAIEQSLDVEWVHAIAPLANIVLVEASTSNEADLFTAAVNTARNLPGVDVVSMSFGEGEFAGETAYDSLFTTPANHQGITFMASTGDGGAAETSYPGFSPNVVAVGGTAITTGDTLSDYGTETVWNDQYGATGGGVSFYEPKPSYQSAVTQSATNRTVPDVSFDAAVTTGVYVLDTSQPGGGGYYEVGGTSLATPCWGGLIAIADQARAQIGLNSLDGPSQTLPRLYQLSSSDYHDVLAGQNAFNSYFGYSAGPGYDLDTGRGTPIANVLIPDLAGGAIVTGQAFQDNNSDALYDGNDQPLANKTVYLDLNNLGSQTSIDPTAVTDSNGNFVFNDIVGGVTGTVRLATVPSGYVQVGTSPLATAFNASSSDTLAFFPTIFTDSNNGDSYTLRISPTLSSQAQILVNGVLTYITPTTLPPSFAFNFSGTNDSFTIDAGNGNPVPTGGVSFNGTNVAKGNTFALLATNGNDTITANATSIAFGANPINFANTANLVIDPRQGTDNLTVNGGSVKLPAQAANGFLVRQFSNLSVASGASLAVGTAAIHSDRTVILATGTLSINAAGKFDLGGNDMIVRSGDYTGLSTLIGSGFGNGTWTGNGIDSAAAASNPMHLTALGILLNDDGYGDPVYSLFDFQKVFDGDVIIKYTYYGDSNLDGKVDGTDYNQIDFGLANHLSGWLDGDFNYSGSVDGTDYSLIDMAFNMQGTQL